MTKRLQGMARKRFKTLYPKDSVLQFSNNGGFITGIRFNGEDRALYSQAIKKLKYIQGWDKVVFYKESLCDILNKKKYPSGSKVFVNSMSDTFHKDISNGDIVELFYSMAQREDLTFQILTKRADRMLEFFKWYVPSYVIGGFSDYFYEDCHKHIWFGVTAENQEYADNRIPQLLELKAILNNKIKCFVSLEPLLSAIDLTPYLDRLDWVIVGGEKIPNNPRKARLMKLEWVESLYRQCKNKDVPFFFKQWGNTDAYRELMKHYIERCKEFPYKKEWIVEVRGCDSSNFYEKVEFDTEKEALAYRAGEYVNRRIFHKDTNRLAREHREKLEKRTQKDF